MKVWVVLKGDYDDQEIVAVYNSAYAADVKRAALWSHAKATMSVPYSYDVEGPFEVKS